MIQIKKPKYEYDNYCTCCWKPFEDSMEVSFFHKDYNDSVNITLCGKCREELMEVLSKADSNSALDHIHNVVAENEYKRGYKEGYEQGKADVSSKWIPVSERMPEEGHDVLITKEPFKIKGYEQEVIKAKRSVDPRSGKIEWWSEFGTLTDKAVLAWMPLPEPYMKGEQYETN